MKYRLVDNAMVAYSLLCAVAAAVMGATGRWPVDVTTLAVVVCLSLAWVFRTSGRLRPPMRENSDLDRLTKSFPLA